MFYEVVFGIIEVKGWVWLANDLFAELDCHVVGIVGILDDSSDDESRCKFGEHNQL